jgi:hypothetical protein
MPHDAAVCIISVALLLLAGIDLCVVQPWNIERASRR